MNLDQTEIMKTATEGRAEDLRDTLRSKAIASLYFFAKAILGYNELAPLHLAFCDQVQSSIQQLKRGYLLPRGHFKSTLMKSYILWRLVGGGLRGEDDPRNLRFLMVGESASVAEKGLRDIKWQIENNQLLQWLFPEIIPPDIGNTKWAEDEILLPRLKSFDESTITTAGVGAKRTGFHFDIIIYDDIIGEKAANSLAVMKESIEWFQYAPGLLNDQETSEELIVGTRWKYGRADLYGWIMAELPFGTHESGRPMGFTWYERAAIEDDRVIFPERFSIAKLEEIRRREKDYKFSCQYMNRPSSPEGADFPEELLKSFRVVEDDEGRANKLLPSDGSAPVYLRHLVRVSFYDPSAGGKSATAENALIFAGMDHLRRVFVLAAWSRNCGFRAAIEKWLMLNDQFLCYNNYYECVGAQKEVEEIVREVLSQLVCRVCNKTHKRLNPLPSKPPGGKTIKEERIRLWCQNVVEEERLYIREGLVELRRQITSFPHGDLVDQFDALAGAIHYLRPPLSQEEFESRKIEEEEHKNRQQRTSQEYEVGGYV
jgi:hypothetical protein